MKKNLPLIVIGLLVLLGISTFIVVKFNPNILVTVPADKTAGQIKNTSSEIILFYGNGCPHCAKVEQYMSENKVSEKINISQKEVYGDKNNAALLGEKAHSCGLNTSSIGVPFLWDGPTGKCLVGDEEIVNFFKTKMGK
jgi:glutaredoxin